MKLEDKKEEENEKTEQAKESPSVKEEQESIEWEDSEGSGRVSCELGEESENGSDASTALCTGQDKIFDSTSATSLEECDMSDMSDMSALSAGD